VIMLTNFVYRIQLLTDSKTFYKLGFDTRILHQNQ